MPARQHGDRGGACEMPLAHGFNSWWLSTSLRAAPGETPCAAPRVRRRQPIPAPPSASTALAGASHPRRTSMATSRSSHASRHRGPPPWCGAVTPIRSASWPMKRGARAHREAFQVQAWARVSARQRWLRAAPAAPRTPGISLDTPSIWSRWTARSVGSGRTTLGRRRDAGRGV